VSAATVWVVLLYGITLNLQNFGIDQSYVQRYIAARSDAEARKAVWLGGLLYVPVSALFLLIGTGLAAFYAADPAGLDSLRTSLAEQRLAARGEAGVAGVIAGVLVIATLSLPPLAAFLQEFPEASLPHRLGRSLLEAWPAGLGRLHAFLIPVIGTATILAMGLLAALLGRRRQPS